MPLVIREGRVTIDQTFVRLPLWSYSQLSSLVLAGCTVAPLPFLHPFRLSEPELVVVRTTTSVLDIDLMHGTAARSATKQQC